MSAELLKLPDQDEPDITSRTDREIFTEGLPDGDVIVLKGDDREWTTADES